MSFTKGLVAFGALVFLASSGLPAATLEVAPAFAEAKLFGLSRQEVEEFDFAHKYVDSTTQWRLQRTDRELLRMLRQRAKFVLQNTPDALSRYNAELVVLIVTRVLADGPVPPPPTPPNPPGPQPPDPPIPPPPTPPGPTPPAGPALVFPGQPDRSPLVLQLEQTSQPGMPYNRPLPWDKRKLFRQWVAGGASEQVYRQRLQPVVTSSCVFCHNRTNLAGRLSLSSWEDLKARIAVRLARVGQ